MSAAAAHLPHKPISRTLTIPPTLPNFRNPATLRRSPLRRTAVFVSANSVHSQLRLDAVLEVAEVLCIAPPAVFSIGCLVRVFQVNVQSRVFAAQCVLVVAAVAIGGVIRRRQWERVFTVDGVDLAVRVERVEEEVRRSGAVVRALSRQLEKLGIRFRVTRRALKEPIAETAALSQKNSEATRALAIQEDILEKELGEIQKVLLAMQEQQQKQLELILAIGKAGKLFDTKQDSVTEKTRNGAGNLVPKKEAVKPLEVQKERRTGANDRV